jgi:hypothetical protein
MLSVAGLDIDIELDQLYRSVRSELTYNGEPGHEHPRGDQDSIVVSAMDQLRKLVEGRGELVDDSNGSKTWKSCAEG